MNNYHLERIGLKDDVSPMVVIKEHLLRYIHVLNFVKDKDVLDIACGTGYGMYLMSYWANTVSGYDYKEEAINEAKKYNFRCPSCLEVRNLEDTIKYDNDKTDKFDLITCFETLEHLENPKNLLDSVKKHLRPKGWFVFSVPNKTNLKDGNPWHKKAYNRDTISHLMRSYFGMPGELLGHDQFGFTRDNMNKPYLIGKIQL